MMTEPDLYPHQAEAVTKLRNGCILKGGVGSGKTRTALAYYARLAPWIKLYVITTAKKRDSGDWEAEAKLFGIEPVVDSWNNLFEYVDVKDAFFIFDEQRVVGSGVWVQSFIKVTKENRWILLSATPGESWMDYIPVFVANGFYRNRTEFIREHVQFSHFTKYPKVERYLNTGVLVRHLMAITVEMPFERHTRRHVTDVYVEYDQEKFDTVWKRRWNYLADRPVRHVSELFSLGRRVVNSDDSRLQRVRDLLVLNPKIIIFYNFDYELEILRALKEGEESWWKEMDTREVEGVGSFEVAEWNGHKHQPVPETESWVYLVQYASGAEGWNCIETDTMIFYSLPYSYKQFEQSMGRIDRVNTLFTDLYYYILRSPNVIDTGIYKSLMEKKDFSEVRYMHSLY